MKLYIYSTSVQNYSQHILPIVVTKKTLINYPKHLVSDFAEGRYGLVDKTHPSCVRPGLNTRVQH